jgi:hypothetical protein
MLSDVMPTNVRLKDIMPSVLMLSDVVLSYVTRSYAEQRLVKLCDTYFHYSECMYYVECYISIALLSAFMLTIVKVIVECHFISCHHTDSRGADITAIVQS